MVKFFVKKCKERKQRKPPTVGTLRNMQDNLTQVTGQQQQGVNVIEVQQPIEVETPV